MSDILLREDGEERWILGRRIFVLYVSQTLASIELNCKLMLDQILDGLSASICGDSSELDGQCGVSAAVNI